MSSEVPQKLTMLLQRASSGDKNAEGEVLSLVLPELRRIAARRLRRERPGHTLQTSDLINEAYLRLFGATPVEWQDRAHFFAVAARQMRFILVDHARRKPEGGNKLIPFDTIIGSEGSGLVVVADENLVALDEALRDFEAVDARSAHGVELRFFGGLTQEEVAKVQGINVTTVKRDLAFAKSWLFRRLGAARPGPNKS